MTEGEQRPELGWVEKFSSLPKVGVDTDMLHSRFLYAARYIETQEYKRRIWSAKTLQNSVLTIKQEDAPDYLVEGQFTYSGEKRLGVYEVVGGSSTEKYQKLFSVQHVSQSNRVPVTKFEHQLHFFEPDGSEFTDPAAVDVAQRVLHRLIVKPARRQRRVAVRNWMKPARRF